MISLVGQNRADQFCVMSAQAHLLYRAGVGARHTGVVDLARASVNRLQELVNLFIRHLLAQVGEDCRCHQSVNRSRSSNALSLSTRTVTKLSHTNKPRQVLVENLESLAVFLWLAGIAEATGAVQDLLEGLKVNCQSSCQQ